MDVAARHGDDPGEHAAARLVDGARNILFGTMKLPSATVIAGPFPWMEGHRCAGTPGTSAATVPSTATAMSGSTWKVAVRAPLDPRSSPTVNAATTVAYAFALPKAASAMPEWNWRTNICLL